MIICDMVEMLNAKRMKTADQPENRRKLLEKETKATIKNYLYNRCCNMVN